MATAYNNQYNDANAGGTTDDPAFFDWASNLNTDPESQRFFAGLERLQEQQLRDQQQIYQGKVSIAAPVPEDFDGVYTDSHLGVQSMPLLKAVGQGMVGEDPFAHMTYNIDSQTHDLLLGTANTTIMGLGSETIPTTTSTTTPNNPQSTSESTTRTISDQEFVSIVQDFLSTPLSPADQLKSLHYRHDIHAHLPTMDDTMPQPNPQGPTTTVNTDLPSHIAYLLADFDPVHVTAPTSHAAHTRTHIDSLITDIQTHDKQLRAIEIEKENDPLYDENIAARELVEISNFHKLFSPQQRAVLRKHFDKMTKVPEGGDDQALGLAQATTDLERDLITDALKHATAGENDDEDNNNGSVLQREEVDEGEFSWDKVKLPITFKSDHEEVIESHIQHILRVGFHKMFQSNLDENKFKPGSSLSTHVQFDQYLHLSEKLQDASKALVENLHRQLEWYFDVANGLIEFDITTPQAQAAEKAREEEIKRKKEAKKERHAKKVSDLDMVDTDDDFNSSEGDDDFGTSDDDESEDFEAQMVRLAHHALESMKQHRDQYHPDHISPDQIDTLSSFGPHLPPTQKKTNGKKNRANKSDSNAMEDVKDDDDDDDDNGNVGEDDQNAQNRTTTTQSNQWPFITGVPSLIGLTDEQIDIYRQEYAAKHLKSFLPTKADILACLKGETQLTLYLDMVQNDCFEEDFSLKEWVRVKYDPLYRQFDEIKSVLPTPVAEIGEDAPAATADVTEPTATPNTITTIPAPPLVKLADAFPPMDPEIKEPELFYEDYYDRIAAQIIDCEREVAQRQAFDATQPQPPLSQPQPPQPVDELTQRYLDMFKDDYEMVLPFFDEDEPQQSVNHLNNNQILSIDPLEYDPTQQASAPNHLEAEWNEILADMPHFPLLSQPHITNSFDCEDDTIYNNQQDGYDDPYQHDSTFNNLQQQQDDNASGQPQPKPIPTPQYPTKPNLDCMPDPFKISPHNPENTQYNPHAMSSLQALLAAFNNPQGYGNDGDDDDELVPIPIQLDPSFVEDYLNRGATAV